MIVGWWYDASTLRGCLDFWNLTVRFHSLLDRCCDSFCHIPEQMGALNSLCHHLTYIFLGVCALFVANVIINWVSGSILPVQASFLGVSPYLPVFPPTSKTGLLRQICFRVFHAYARIKKDKNQGILMPFCYHTRGRVIVQLHFFTWLLIKWTKITGIK